MLLFPPTLPLLSSLLPPLVKSLPVFALSPLLSFLPCFCVKSCLDVNLFALFFFYFGVPSTPSCFSSTRLFRCVLFHPPPPPPLHPGLHFALSTPSPPSPPAPPVLGGLCAVVTPCRSEGTMWPSWTLSASWTPIWTRVSPLTLSPPPTSWVRR